MSIRLHPVVPVVHDLQFGTYASPPDHRGRHGSWPCWCGLTRSHGLRAGAWVRIGDRSFWCCLQRPRRMSRAERARRPVEVPSTPVRPHLPPDTPPPRTDRLDGPERASRALVALTALFAIAMLALTMIGAAKWLS